MADLNTLSMGLSNLLALGEQLNTSANTARWFLPFVLPICAWTAYSDMRLMRIPNVIVYTLAAVFVVVGLLALPLPDYAWRLSHLVVVLVIGFVLNAGGLVGAGDAKFAAAAAPFVAASDFAALLPLFAATLLAAFATHRLAKFTPLRRIAPDWESWERGKDFPMGLALAGTLALYLLFCAF